MAQGKLKVKAKKPGVGGNKSNKKQQNKVSRVTKKGRKVLPPKKAKAREAARLHKATEKGIRGTIEATLAQRAKQVEEGKAFSIIKAPENRKSNK